MKIRVGTRGSHLALTQTKWLIEKLKEKHSDVEFELKIVKTKGDIVRDVPLHEMGDKGIFVKELERELMDGEIDIAVHSMKDLPSELPEGLVLARSPKREDARDVLVLKEPFSSPKGLKGRKIGTGSRRRTFQLRDYGAEAVPVRGNIETRISKIDSEGLDGVMLAAAGMLRAGYKDRISLYLPEEEFVPSPCQGVLAVEVRQDDVHILELINSISDEETMLCVDFERTYLREVGASCHSPVGAYSRVEGDELVAVVLFGEEDGRRLIKKKSLCKIGERKELAKRLAEEVKEELKHDVQR